MSQTNSRSGDRIAFLDHIRYLMVLLVVVYHAVAAYATVAPHWSVHDATFFEANIVRELLDVFMMPVLFFVAGYFALRALEKAGLWGFLKDKVKRLLIPWALSALIVTPLLVYDQPDQLVRPFRDYWLWFVGRFQGQLGFLLPGQPNQNIFWFLSLLFIFFALFALIYAARRRWGGRAAPAPTAARDRSPLVALVWFGLLTAAASFVGLLLFPDTSWYTFGVLLQFEPVRLAVLAGCFALGVYAQSRGWFAQPNRLGSPALWGALGAVLAAVYLVVGQRLFADPAGTTHLQAGYLLAFAFLRSFLLLSLLVTFVTFGARFWNRSNAVDRQLASTSYNMYLSHIWIVVVVQTGLVSMAASPVIKFALALLVGLLLSFSFSRWVLGRWPRAVAGVLLVLFVFCLAVRP